jgi:hypothetical protein
MRSAIFVSLLCCSLYSQTYCDDPRLKLIPGTIVHVVKKHNDIKIYNAISPLFYTADFDGDGKADYVVRIQGVDGKLGLLFLLSSIKHELILGFNKKDDVAIEWTFTEWRLYRHWQKIWGESKERSSSRTGDYLELVWEGRGGGFLEFRNGKFNWVGQGE